METYFLFLLSAERKAHYFSSKTGFKNDTFPIFSTRPPLKKLYVIQVISNLNVSEPEWNDTTVAYLTFSSQDMIQHWKGIPQEVVLLVVDNLLDVVEKMHRAEIVHGNLHPGGLFLGDRLVLSC